MLLNSIIMNNSCYQLIFCKRLYKGYLRNKIISGAFKIMLFSS